MFYIFFSLRKIFVFQVARLGDREGMGEITEKKFKTVEILLISTWFLSMKTLFEYHFQTPIKWFHNFKIG